MELLFVTVIGAALALGVRYAVPGRETHGLLLVPAIGAAATAATWVLLVWLGFTFDGGWIWVFSLVIGPAVALAFALLLPPRRRAADEALLASLMRPGQPVAARTA
ncbi:hypothetical protein [Microcella alkalica]|uniref:hypothetical protein n=1 Tax=Microcella alkalica TaxID=355930 RepID=UPI00145FA8F8|nr:hypothetical protein [Microcella alkalica]